MKKPLQFLMAIVLSFITTAVIAQNSQVLSKLTTGFVSQIKTGEVSPTVLYYDFEGPVSTHPTFSETSATFLGVKANPLKDAVNESDSVGLTKTSATDWDGIYLKLKTAIDLSNDTVFTILVYHPDSAGAVRLQFDGNGSQLKLNRVYDTPGAWKMLTYEIPKTYDDKFTSILLVCDHNNGQAGGADGADVEEWYFDELRGPATNPELGAVLYFNFQEIASLHPTFTETTATFEGVVENPEKSGMNLSDSVGLSKTSATDWDGIIYKFDLPIDLSTDTLFTMLVYHPDSAGAVRLQFDGNGSQLKINQPYTTPGSWQLLSYRLPKTYDDKFTQVLLVFDHNNGQAGGADGADVEYWYFDELRGAPENLPPAAPKDYYNTVNFRKDWSGFDNAVYELADNPKISTANSNLKAGKFMTGTTSWAGIYYDIPAAVDFTESSIFRMMVYSDSVGYVRIALEKPGVSQKLKLSVNYTTPGEWKEITFDPAIHNVGDPIMDDTWTRIVLVFDDKDTDVGEEWYFDWVKGPRIGEVAPQITYFDFEQETPAFFGWANAVWAGTVANPLKDDVNPSDSVGEVWTGSETWAGIAYDLPSTVDFTEGLNFSIKVFTTDSVGRFRVTLEKAGDAANKYLTAARYTTPGQWAEVVTSHTISGMSGNVIDDFYNRIVLIPDDTTKQLGEQWFFDDLKGPALTPVYNVDVLFTVTQIDTDAEGYKIQFNNDGTMIDLYNDGTNGDATADDNIWTVLMVDLPAGDHVYDVYGDGELAFNGDDIEINVPMMVNQYTINFDDYKANQVPEDLLNSGLAVYPNPTKGNLVLESTQLMQQVKIYRIDGAEIMNIQLNQIQKYELNTQDLMPGLYIISITDNEGNKVSSRFIKQ